MGAHYVDVEEGITSLLLEKSLDLLEKNINFKGPEQCEQPGNEF